MWKRTFILLGRSGPALSDNAKYPVAFDTTGGDQRGLVVKRLHRTSFDRNDLG